jgi:hypothetical protein
METVLSSGWLIGLPEGGSRRDDQEHSNGLRRRDPGLIHEGHDLTCDNFTLQFILGNLALVTLLGLSTYLRIFFYVL